MLFEKEIPMNSLVARVGEMCDLCLDVPTKTNAGIGGEFKWQVDWRI